MEHLETIRHVWRRATVSQYDNVVIINFDENNEPFIRIQVDTATGEVQFFNQNLRTDAKALISLLEAE